MCLQNVGLGGHGLGCCGSGWRQVGGVCECGNEPSGSIKCGEFLEWLRYCSLVMKVVVTHITNSSMLCTREFIICILFCMFLRYTYVADLSLGCTLRCPSYHSAGTAWRP
jgi:hypothetical protein